MRVIATGKGHCGKQIREPGDEFDFPDSALKKDAGGKVVFPSWFKAAEQKKAKAEKDPE